MFAPKPSGRSLCTRVDARRHGAGDVRDHDELVDLRTQRRQRLLELGRVPVRDDDGGDVHTEHLAVDVGRQRAVSSHEKRRARSSPART